MTRAQVRDVLGSPLLTDPFHADRWDYVFTIRRQGFDDQQLRRVVVLFDKDEVLASIDGAATLPSERRVRRLDRTSRSCRATTPTLELTERAAQGAAGAGRGRRAGRVRRRAAGADAHLPAARAAAP